MQFCCHLHWAVLWPISAILENRIVWHRIFTVIWHMKQYSAIVSCNMDKSNDWLIQKSCLNPHFNELIKTTAFFHCPWIWVAESKQSWMLRALHSFSIYLLHSKDFHFHYFYCQKKYFLSVIISIKQQWTRQQFFELTSSKYIPPLLLSTRITSFNRNQLFPHWLVRHD